jgi:hypothetical protein
MSVALPVTALRRLLTTERSALVLGCFVGQ